MDSNYEFWSTAEWMSWISKREEIMEEYLRALRKYQWLPACDYLVDVDLRKKYSCQELDLAYDTIVSPVNRIIHEWERDEESQDDGDDTESSGAGDSGSKRKMSGSGDPGERCYQGIVRVIDKWVQVMKGPLAREQWLVCIQVLCGMSQIENYIIASNAANESHEDARSSALLQVCMFKCDRVFQHIKTMFDNQKLSADFLVLIESIMKELVGLVKQLKVYLSTILTPGKKD